MEQKLAALQRSGCQDKIAWSRTGCIGAIDNDSVKFSYLRCIDGENYGFSTPSTITRPQNNGTPFKHLSWNPSGNDIAAVDVQGDISVFSINNTGAFSSVFDSSTSSEQQQQEMHEMDSIVGLKWLNNEKAAVIAGPAFRPGNSTQNSNQLASYNGLPNKQLVGPYNPTHRQALVAVTRRGILRLICQIAADDLRYYEICVALETQPDLLSHACIKGMTDKSLMVATYTLDGIVKLYKIGLEWKAVQKPNTQNFYLPSTDFASFNVKRVLKKGVTSEDNNQFLTHIMIPPTVPSVEKDVDELILVFTSNEKSTVNKYELSATNVPLHSNFYQIGGKREDGGGTDLIEWSMNLVESVDKDPLLKAELIINDLFIHYCTFKGQIEFKTRTKWANSENKTVIHSLLDVGYYMDEQDINEMCISPNMVGLVYYNENRDIKIKTLVNDIDYENDENSKLGSIVAMAQRTTASCCMGYSNEDLLLLIKQQVEKCKTKETRTNFINQLLNESHRGVSFQADVHREYPVDKLLMTPSYQKVLSLQMAIGTFKDWKRDEMGRMAWGLLNIRLVAFVVAFSLRSLSIQKPANITPQQDFENRANQINNSLGLLRWVGDFLSCVAQQLYTIGLKKEKEKGGGGDDYFNPDVGNVPIAIIMAKIPRVLLLYSLRGFRGMEALVHKHLQQERTISGGGGGGGIGGGYLMEPASRAFTETYTTSPVSLLNFEKVLTDIDTTIKTTFDPKQTGDMIDQEHELMFWSKFPKEYLPIINRTVEVFTKNTKPEINIPVLHFYDTSWLKLLPNTEDGSKLSGTEIVDQLKKFILTFDDGNMNKKVCTKCGILTDGIRSNTQWSVAFGRNCLCGGNWYRPDKTILQATGLNE